MASASEDPDLHPRPIDPPTADFHPDVQHNFDFDFDFPPLYHPPGHSPLPDSYFDDAYVPLRASPSPPTTRFLDSILNSAHAPSLPFGYYHLASASPLRRSPSVPPCPGYTAVPMPPVRSARLPNGYVDLTGEPDVIEIPSQRTKRESPTPGPSAKRLRRDDGSAAHVATPPARIEEIDLSEDQTSVQDVLQKQRADAIKAQQKPEEKATSFKTFTCVICMDTPTDITATSCGHLFCHECLMTALIAGENRSGPSEPKRSQCPVCRKIIGRNKASDVIPISLMRQSEMNKQRTESAPAPVPSSKVFG